MTFEIAFHNYAVRFEPRARELFTICVLCIISIESFGKIGRSSRRLDLVLQENLNVFRSSRLSLVELKGLKQSKIEDTNRRR